MTDENGGHVSLKEYIEKLCATNERAHSESSKRYREEIERRLTALNELRAEVTKDRDQYVLKASYEPTIKQLADWKSIINDRITIIETRSYTWNAALGVFFTLLQIGLGVATFFLLKK